MGERYLSASFGYWLAFAATVCVALARFALTPLLGGNAAFLPFVLSVMAAAWYGGLGPGLLATGLGALTGLYLFTPSLPSLHVGEPRHLIQLAIFVVIGFTVSGLSEALHNVRRRLEADRLRLERENQARRRIEERLRENEERLTFALNAARMVAWDFNLTTGQSERSLNAGELFGIGSGPAEDFLQLIHPDDRLRVDAALLAVSGGESEYEQEFRVRGPDGRVMWIFDKGQARVDSASGQSYLTGVSIDVTQRKTAEESVRESEQRLKAIFDQATVGIAQCDLSGRIVQVNPGFCRIVQRSKDVLLQLRMQELIHPDELRAWQERGLPEGETREMRFLRPDGSAVWVSNSMAFLESEEGVPLFSVTVSVDITERVQAEQANAQLAAIVHSSHEAILSLALDGTVLTWNPAAERIFGYRAEEIVGRSVALMVPCDQQAESAEWFERVRAGETVARETTRLRKDGSVIDVLLSRAPIYSAARVTAVAATVEDISERKRTEARVHQLVADLRAADRRKDEFLAMLAHELRNPLAPITTSLEVMETVGMADPKLKWCQAVIKRQTAQLTRLVDDLLNVSRLTQGKIPLVKRRAALDEIIESAIETSRPLIDRHHQRLVFSFPPERLYVDADPLRLAQAVSNLLSNASKYSDDGSLIDVSVVRSDARAVVRVEDNGKGIPADLLPYVFDLFTQGDQSLARLQGGLGVGLTVVRRIVELHGGSVGVESPGAGRGSTFTIELPLVPEETAAKEVAPALRASMPMPARRILVVDDNVDSAEVMEGLLQALGHEVRVSFDGNQALQVAREFGPELVLLDIGLPGMDGFEVISRLRGQVIGPKPVIAALTGYGRSEDRERVLDAGFDHHLMKPVDLATLNIVLESLRQPVTDPIRSAVV